MQPLAKLLTITITIGKYCLPALAIVMILGGCGGPRWDQLDQIQMVRPLPEPLPGDMEHTALGAGYIGSPGGEGSFFGSDLRIAAAITDNRDSVLGKSCLSVTMAHRILYVQTNYRYVIEADIGKASGVGTVPEALTLVALASQSVAGKPTGRSIMGLGDTGIVMSSARGEISQCVSMMEEAIFETRGDPDSSRISQMRNKRFAGASIRLSKALNQSMEIMLTGKRIGGAPVVEDNFGDSNQSVLVETGLVEIDSYYLLLSPMRIEPLIAREVLTVVVVSAQTSDHAAVCASFDPLGAVIQISASRTVPLHERIFVEVQVLAKTVRHASV